MSLAMINISSSKKKNKQGNVMPKPVYPHSLSHHGLLGVPYLHQHMIVDEKWTPASLTEEFQNMSNLLSKRRHFKKLEYSANHKKLLREYRILKRQCRDGRYKLQKYLHGNNNQAIRHFLIHNKEMQRLYNNLPIHMVLEKINQRTFGMRKERDRLRDRLERAKLIYQNKVKEKNDIENRRVYENEYLIEEEVKSKEFIKKLQDSKVRLEAIKTINSTYQKMIKILSHDGMFYEPILSSLNKDIGDQQQFIKHILFLGAPAMTKFRDLSDEYRNTEEKIRKQLHGKQHDMNVFQKNSKEQKRGSYGAKPAKADDPIRIQRFYVRETRSMLYLKSELNWIESIIKRVKFATLCSKSGQILPRMKSQADRNVYLIKNIEKNGLGVQLFETKLKRAEVLGTVLVNNLSLEEIQRETKIKDLRQQIDVEDDIEKDIINAMKMRSDSYVLLRFTLWNLCEILHYVDRPHRVHRGNYPNSYLNLPLLKFEMLTMYAVPPELYEENVKELLHVVKRKLRVLMGHFKTYGNADTQTYLDYYHQIFLDQYELDELSGAQEREVDIDNLIIDARDLKNVATRKHIKSISARLVEEFSKKDD